MVVTLLPSFHPSLNSELRILPLLALNPLLPMCLARCIVAWHCRLAVMIHLVRASINPQPFPHPTFLPGVRGSLYRGLAVMVVASPCALAVAPLAYFAAVTACAAKVSELSSQCSGCASVLHQRPLLLLFCPLLFSLPLPPFPPGRDVSMQWVRIIASPTCPLTPLLFSSPLPPFPPGRAPQGWPCPGRHRCMRHRGVRQDRHPHHRTAHHAVHPANPHARVRRRPIAAQRQSQHITITKGG